MSPLAALPDHRFLPAPLWLLTALHLLTLTLHFVAMNTLLGGVVVALFGRVEDRWNRPGVRRLLSLFPVLMAATVTLGVAPLLFVQLTYGKVIYSATVTSGGFWILVPVVAIGAYYALYAAAHRPAGDASARRWLLVALAGLLFVSVVYSATFSLAERPADYAALYRSSPSGWAVNPDVAAWGPRWLHAVLGAVALGAFVASWVAREDAAVARAARGVFFAAIGAAALLGLAYLGTLGAWVKPFMRSAGIGWLAGGVLAAGLGTVLVWQGKRLPAAACLLLSLAAMVATRHELRGVVLSDSFDPEALPVRPQWDVFALFVLCLLAAVGVIAWMLRAWFRAPATDARA